MPWQAQSRMDNRSAFARLAAQGGVSVAALCRRFGISRKTGYKWLGRAQAAVLALRADHPSWGGRKLRRRLQDLGRSDVPAAATITAVLARHGCLGQPAAEGPQPVTYLPEQVLPLSPV